MAQHDRDDLSEREFQSRPSPSQGGGVTCRDFERLWNELLDAPDGAAAALERALENHTAACEACRTVAVRYQTLRRAIHALRARLSPPADVTARLLERIERRRSEPTRKTIRLHVFAGVAAAAALVVACLLSLRGGLSNSDRTRGKPPLADAQRPWTAALADATSATWDLARTASAPAARIGSEVLSDTTVQGATTTLLLPTSGVPASQVLQQVGDRINAGVRPLSGSARHAFGFLLEPALEAERSAPETREGA